MMMMMVVVEADINAERMIFHALGLAVSAEYSPLPSNVTQQC